VIVSGEIVPIAVLAPYAAAGIGTDVLMWGRYPLDLNQTQTLTPDTLNQLSAGNTGNPEQAQASISAPVN
jgi:hypothetical protein